MQAPKAPWGRGRGRGPPRGGALLKGHSDNEHNQRDGRKTSFASISAGTPAFANSTSPHAKAGQPSLRNKQLRNTRTPNSARQPNSISSNERSPLSSGSSAVWRDPTIEGNATYTKRMSELYQTLKKNREKERKDAIRDGVLADPDKPTLLADAITPVGTCQDMCPEFERVERIVQLMVDGCEKIPSRPADGKDVPCEDYMVKRFRRSAAGYDEQLPSDIRPPIVLQRTLDYLLDEVIGGPRPLAGVHKFVWDRTRGIRNDFSIQQVSRAADLRIAIDCFERIARFHILSLHQLSRPDQDNGEFDHHQEREQLNNTLLSLMYYYDDSRHKLKSPNEAEFRAYCIIFEIQDQRPDLEDRSQNWPIDVLKDRRVQTALKLYAAAGNTADEQGPLKPRTPNMIAQADYGKFWSVVASNAVSYLMACAAEIYFNLVRRTALELIWKAYKRGGSIKTEDWSLRELVPTLGFDDEEQVRIFCEDHGFTIGERADGEPFLEIGSVFGNGLSDSSLRRKQVFSRTLVESKRLNRTLSAVINGITASDAAAKGMIEDLSSEDATILPEPGNDSLFIPDHENPGTTPKPVSGGATSDSKSFTKTNPFSSPFNSTTQQSAAGSTTITPSANPFGFAATSTISPVNSFGKASVNTPKMDFFSAANLPSNSTMSSGDSGSFSTISTKPSPFSTTEPPKFTFMQPSVTTTNLSTPAKPAAKSIFGLPSSTAILAPAQTGNPTKHGSSGSAAGTLFDSSPSPKSTPIFQFISPNSPSVPSTSPPISIFSSSKPLDKDNLQKPPTSPNLSLPTENSSPPISLILSQPQQSAASSSPTNPLPTNGAESSTSPLNPSRSAQPQEPAKPTNRLSGPSTTPFKPAKSSTFATTSTNTKPRISSPLAQPAITASNPPEVPLPRREDIRDQAVESLAITLMLEPDGLLHQFIDYNVGAIISDSLVQVQDEQSWKRAGEVRERLLGRRYIRRWKEIAWRLGLLRKGRERRKNFAQSMHNLATSNRRRSTDVELAGFLGLAGISRDKSPPQEPTRNEGRMMPPPEKPRASQSKRKSLDSARGTKRGPSVEEGSPQQRGHQSNLINGSTTRSAKTSAGHHKRSKTVGSVSDMSKPRHGSSSNSESLLRSPSPALRNNLSPTKARQPIPNVGMDTTHTSYFRLKAMGIDPVTMSPSKMPANKVRRKRARYDENEVASTKTPRLTPPEKEPSSSTDSRPSLTNVNGQSRSESQTRRSHTSSVNDEDEQLFAQMRSVREAMSESINWFQGERAKSEFSRSTSHDETFVSAGARVFVSTPSRTEQRLARTGGHGLAAKAVVKKGSTSEGKKPMNKNCFGDTEGKGGVRQGFAAFDDEEDNAESTRGIPARPALATKGHSIEDAIEL